MSCSAPRLRCASRQLVAVFGTSIEALSYEVQMPNRRLFTIIALLIASSWLGIAAVEAQSAANVEQEQIKTELYSAPISAQDRRSANKHGRSFCPPSFKAAFRMGSPSSTHLEKPRTSQER